MKIDIVTLFPKMFSGPFDDSMVKAAQVKNLVEINIYNLRDWTTDAHHTVDDRPFGGGKGMIIKVEPVYKCLKDLKKKNSKVILLTPQGRTFNQKMAKDFSSEKHLIFLAGHYEGFDERVHENLIDNEVSIGDFVLTGGEIPAMVIVDTIVRLIPGVLEPEATLNESFSLIADSQNPTAILDFPQYTRPEKFLKWSVPQVLLSGDHKEIEKYRMKSAIEKTKRVRPDLLEK